MLLATETGSRTPRPSRKMAHTMKMGTADVMCDVFPRSPALDAMFLEPVLALAPQYLDQRRVCEVHLGVAAGRTENLATGGIDE